MISIVLASAHYSARDAIRRGDRRFPPSSLLFMGLYVRVKKFVSASPSRTLLMAIFQARNQFVAGESICIIGTIEVCSLNIEQIASRNFVDVKMIRHARHTQVFNRRILWYYEIARTSFSGDNSCINVSMRRDMKFGRLCKSQFYNIRDLSVLCCICCNAINCHEKKSLLYGNVFYCYNTFYSLWHCRFLFTGI